MCHHITFIISILLVISLAACQSDFKTTLPTFQNCVFEESDQPMGERTQMTWSDRELTIYPLSHPSETGLEEFMLVDHMGERTMEYILRNGRLAEARFSLPDGSLVRFDLAGLPRKSKEPIVYHCTAHSNALYEMSYLPPKLASQITEFQAGFWDWNPQETGKLHVGHGGCNIPSASILKSMCSAGGAL